MLRKCNQRTRECSRGLDVHEVGCARHTTRLCRDGVALCAQQRLPSKSNDIARWINYCIIVSEFSIRFCAFLLGASLCILFQIHFSDGFYFHFAASLPLISQYNIFLCIDFVLLYDAVVRTFLSLICLWSYYHRIECVPLAFFPNQPSQHQWH